MSVKTRSVLLTYIDQMGGVTVSQMVDILDSLQLADDDRYVIKQQITPCGLLTLVGMTMLINVALFKEPPSQANSRIKFLSYLDACGRFSRADWVEFLNGSYLVNEGVVNPADRDIYLAVVDNNNGAMTLEYDTDATTLTGSTVMVAIGSSTMAGNGSTSGFSLASRLSTWFSGITGGAGQFVNLAIGGYYSDRELPDGESPLVDISANITRALSYKVPGKKLIILCSLVSNDAAINTNAKFLENLKRIDEYARERGAIVFFSTTQPRTSFNATQQQLLYDGAILIKQAFGSRAIDVFNLLRDQNASTLAVIKPELNSGDGIHVNNTGHGILFEEYKNTLLNYFSSNIGVVDHYKIESSDFATGPWATYLDNISPTTVAQIVNPKNNKWYRATKYLVSGQTKVSNVDTLTVVTTTTLPPPDPGLQRILIDLGGDGSNSQGALTVSPDGFGNYWNNITNVGVNNFQVLSNAKDTANNVTSVGMLVVTRTGGTYNAAGTDMNYGGLVENVGDYPASAVRDNAYVYNNPSTGGQWKITGLLANRTYSIKFWGCRSDPSARWVEIQKNGDLGWVTYNATNNRDFNNAAVFTNITGVTEMTFNLRTGSGSTFGHVSVIDIQSISNDLTTTTTTTTTIPPNTQRMLIDFGGNDTTTGLVTASPDPATGYAWNNVTNSTTGIKLANMLDTAGNPSGHSLSFLGLIGGTFGLSGTQFNGNGPTTAAINDYPINAVRDNIYAHTTGGTQQWTLTGLRANYTYRIKFWGSRTDNTNRSIQIKRSTESTWQTYNASNNTNYNTAAVFDGITGVTSITFDISVVAGSTFGHISILDIQCTNNAVTTTTTTTTTGTTTTTTVAPNSRRVLIDWGGGGAGNTSGAQTPSPDANGRYWNNLTTASSGVELLNMVNAANGATTMDFTVVTQLYGTYGGTQPYGLNYAGATAAVGDYPLTAVSDSAFVHTSASNAKLRLSGLDSTKTYRVKFWGSRTGTTGVRTITITSQLQTRSYNGVGNSNYETAAVFLLSGLDAYEFIVTTGDDGSEFGYIGVIDIQWSA